LRVLFESEMWVMAHVVSYDTLGADGGGEADRRTGVRWV
jgi:hypothetical protein